MCVTLGTAGSPWHLRGSAAERGLALLLLLLLLLLAARWRRRRRRAASSGPFAAFALLHGLLGFHIVFCLASAAGCGVAFWGRRPARGAVGRAAAAAAALVFCALVGYLCFARGEHALWRPRGPEVTAALCPLVAWATWVDLDAQVPQRPSSRSRDR
jgi:hypothetical protein